MISAGDLRNVLMSLGVTCEVTHHGAVKRASRNMPPFSRKLRKISESVSSKAQAPYPADRSIDPAAQSLSPGGTSSRTPSRDEPVAKRPAWVGCPLGLFKPSDTHREWRLQ